MPRLLLLASVLLACVLLPSAARSLGEDDDRTGMEIMLDDLESLMTGNQEFDRDYLDHLRSCMDDFDSDLVESNDKAWLGVRDYWASNGTGVDFWGKNTLVYIENNETLTPQVGMPVYEPCDHSSNVAYYHSATEICARMRKGEEDGLAFNFPDEYVRGLGVSFSGLAMGSSMMHMSHTDLGGLIDVRSEEIVGYIIHQACVSALGDASPIITDLQKTKRTHSGIELAEEFKTMYMNLPPSEWAAHVNALDIPPYYLTFSGIVATLFTVGFGDERVDKWVPFLSESFGVPEDIQEFIVNDYLPEIRNVTTGVNLNIIQKKNFIEDALSTLGKLVYAFLWQEDVLTQNPFFLNETVNGIGADYIPIVNGFLNNLNSFTFYEQDFQDGQDVYPGDFWCNPVIPHAKWHLESALGLLDLAYLADVTHHHLASMKN